MVKISGILQYVNQAGLLILNFSTMDRENTRKDHPQNKIYIMSQDSIQLAC